MPFWVCYYHIIWATKNRAPLITPKIEPILYYQISEKSSQLAAPILAIQAVADHVHVVVSIPPKLSVAEWTKKIKGISSREINTHFPDQETSFYWQVGYGVLTFGENARTRF